MRAFRRKRGGTENEFLKRLLNISFHKTNTFLPNFLRQGRGDLSHWKSIYFWNFIGQESIIVRPYGNFQKLKFVDHSNNQISEALTLSAELPRELHLIVVCPVNAANFNKFRKHPQTIGEDRGLIWLEKSRLIRECTAAVSWGHGDKPQ